MSSLDIRPAPSAGRLDAAVRVAFGMTGAAARRAVHSGKISVYGRRETDPGRVVTAGTEITYQANAPRPIRTEPLGVRLVYRDEHVLVVDKPAGLLSVPYPEEQEPSALDSALQLCRGVRVAKVVHRLDKLTSGLMMFARSSAAARALRAAIDERRAHRTYRCVVVGVPLRAEATIVSDLVEDRGDGYRGSAGGIRRLLPVDAAVDLPSATGKQAITRYRTVAVADGHAALEVKLETGRTHQIRIHLAEIGHPLLGEQVYARNDEAPRHALHAARLAFPHPLTGRLMEFESPWPTDLARVRPLGPGWAPEPPPSRRPERARPKKPQ